MINERRDYPQSATSRAALIVSAGNRVGGMTAGVLHPVRQRFLHIQRRNVHYLRAGEGPPVVVLHSAILSARFELPLIQQLATDHTVFAFDNPGFGESDPLPKRSLRIADAADALNATLLALKVPRCPVYGTHTGGAIAVELARRHPARVAALIVNGPNIFGRRDTKFLLSDKYRPAVVVKDDGSQLLADWVKSRDALTWFPWSRRGAKNRRPVSFPPPEKLHDSFLDRLRAGNGYQAIYGAVFKHDLCKAVRSLTVPATFMAHAHDILYPHLDRLPKLKSNQRIGRYPADFAAYVNETARAVRAYRVQAKAPLDVPRKPTRGAINRRYVDLAGGQILVRSMGEKHRGRPLLLIHDGRASSRVFEPLMRALARSRPVYAPDLPDNGASDTLATRRPTIADYAEAVTQAAVGLRIEGCDIYAVGAGATVALHLRGVLAFARSRMLLEAPDFYPRALARRLAREWVPPLTPEWDGGHLNRLWLMLRDEYAFWPWFDKSPAATCLLDAPTDWQEMHARVVDILRSLPTYHRLTAAALRYDWRTTLRRLGNRAVKLAATANEPRRPYVEAAVRLAQLSQLAVLPVETEKKAHEILRLLRP